jgi:deoxyribonuclease V
VHYAPERCAAACALLADWGGPVVEEEVVRLPPAAPYVAGRFFERELPPLLALLGALSRSPGAAVVDGYVQLAPDDRPGLGAHLFEALGGSVPVIGVAKTAFAGATHAIAVRRGSSERALWITAAGIDPRLAAQLVASMRGAHRIPEALARADRLARQALRGR